MAQSQRVQTPVDNDDTIIQLRPLPKEIAGQEAGLFNNQGEGLAPRPPDFDERAAQSDIAIDLGTGEAIYLDDDITSDPPELVKPWIKENREPPPFGENLAITLGLAGRTLDGLGSEALQGVDADILSRQMWIDQYNKGIDLLGLKIEELSQRGGVRRNISRVGHPLMLEAMVKYQAGAAAEMLPAMGPVKVPTIGRVPDDIQMLANAFEDDLNYYLTDVAKEYYPDTGRMLMHQAFCGIGYKKVYRCPIRRRPVSESVLAPDLIVSEEATDLDSALRVTHRIDMLKSTLRRMQIVGQYRDIDLGLPGASSFQFSLSAQRKIRESDGLTTVSLGRPEDSPYEILEIDQDIDIDDHMIDGYWERRTPDGLPLPYKLTVDRGSQQVLGLWRNWRPDDSLCLKRNGYVKFGMIPGLGFHDWGFLQLLGNQTRALRAIWRLLIDCGMLSNFPGGIKNKNIRTMTNEIMPAPGEFVDVDAPLSADLTKQFVPMPYKDVSSPLVQFQDMVKNESQQLAGLVLAEQGEGRTNIPVGTIMAFVEDKIQVMAQVYKRNHQAQKEEFNKIRELFAENPKDLWILTRDRPTDPDAPRQQWSRAEEFTNLALRPASDPNVPSRIHRLMVDNVLAMLAQQAPQVFDIPAVARDIVADLGKDPSRYVLRPEQMAQNQQPPPDPRLQAAQIQAQTKESEIQAKGEADDKKMQLEREKMNADTSKTLAQNETAQKVEQIKQQANADQANAEAAGEYQLENIRQQGESARQRHQVAHEQAMHHSQNMSDFLHQQHQTAADHHEETIKHTHALGQQDQQHQHALGQQQQADQLRQANPANQPAPPEEGGPQQPPGGMGA
jgi:hypothetical protein